jgi:lincosamide nucleotidyltransferase A/C/D/E
VPTSVADVEWLLELMRGAGAAPVVAGGWGVDALARVATRTHRDLDVLVEHDVVDTVVARLLDEGFVVTTDWLPVRIELTDASNDRHVDIHPTLADGQGGRWQHGLDGSRYDYPAEALTTGTIGTTEVYCLTAAKQVQLHSGYEPREADRHDLLVLAQLRTEERDRRS